MDATATSRKEAKPTREQIAQEAFAGDVLRLFKAWREAGKPRKR